MCAESKQNVNAQPMRRRPCQGLLLWLFSVLFVGLTESAVAASASQQDARPEAAGSVALGEPDGGITDHVFVAAPPNFQVVIERNSGSFVDCGDGMDLTRTDAAGRRMSDLDCRVTLTETVVIPAASASATVIIHY